MEINVTSRETIKPSKPTPPENQTFNLCAFDILYRNAYFPIILFYRPSTSTNPNISKILKQSLSETLSIFYPIAGRRKDLVTVACNDEGAMFHETTVNGSLSDLLNPPILEFMDKLLPCAPFKIHPPEKSASLPHLMVQVNTFECGSVAIGVCFLHTILDATSGGTFLKAWSEICRDRRDEIPFPDFNHPSSLFPPMDMSRLRAGIISASQKEKLEVTCATRRFVFTEEAINNMRTLFKEVDDNGASTKPTRYQVISSFITKRMLQAYNTKGITSSLLLLIHIIDVRRRRGEPLSASSMGNLLWPAMIACENKVNNNNCVDVNELMKIMREKIGSIDKELFLKIERDPEFLLSDECQGMLMEGMEKKKPIGFVFSSWCNMGFKDVDFGMGKPLWVGYRAGTQETVSNTVVFVDTSQGIETWITIPDQDLAVLLEEDDEFLKYALLNPTVS